MRNFDSLSVSSIIKFVGAKSILVLSLSAIASAGVLAPIAPGSGTVLIVPGVVAVTEPGGAVAMATVTDNYSLVTGASGQIIESVYCDTALVAGACTSSLDFDYQFTNASTSDGIGSLVESYFSGFATSYGYDTSAFGAFSAASGTEATPDTIQRSNGTGNSLTWFFTSTESATSSSSPAESAVLIVHTNATSYTGGIVTIQDGASQYFLNVLSPAPEPGQVGLLLGGLFAAGLFAARKFRVAQS